MTNSHGGRREGSGRPKSEGVKLVRVPLSKIDAVLAVRDRDYHHTMPLYSSKVAAGYPTPTDDSIEEGINLQEFLVKKPSKTFAVNANGDSMIDAGIKSGDMLIVDSSQPGKSGQIIIAVVNGELTVKFLSIRAEQIYLLPANPLFSPIEVSEDADFKILGVVIHVIRTI
ncbi:LexA repressor [Legionella massiliensis]|uniref:LexA repressor n=1 Tax=Legionella massiliensis TaxID=1034943 RepID=A0A078KYG6_9GAMM|nr:translesion error-prone DNA polymerase V autoproteolytic subunit [Legionella massiliensis]CDZ76793.1 LexA repressor [Legionella massiliensis]CEE12531.1 LexA repressor [Legionella massiliensis]